MADENQYHERDLTPGRVYSVVGEELTEGTNLMRYAGKIEGNLFFIREINGKNLITLVCPSDKVIITGEQPIKSRSITLKGLLPAEQKAQITVNFGEYWKRTTITDLDPRYEMLDRSFWGAH